jgi:predicted MFS family arabinose efflux permease
MLAVFVWALSEGLWMNLRPLYFAELGASAEQVGLVLAVGAIASAIVPLPAGLLADRIGARRVMMTAWWLGAVGNALCALATTWQAVIPGYFVNRLSMGANPAVVAYVLHSLPDREQEGNSERLLTTVFITYPIALIFAPALGGILAQKAGIRADLWLAAVGVGLSALILGQTRHVGPRDPNHHAQPALLFRNRPLWLLAGYYTLMLVVLYVGYALAPNYLQDVRGLSLATIGILFSILAVGEFLGTLAVGRLPPRWSTAGLLLVVWVALLGIWQVRSLVGMSAGFFLLSGVSIMWYMVNAGIGRAADPRYQALASGLMESAMAAAIAVASWLAGQLYALTPGHELPFVAGLIGIPPLVAIWFFVPLGGSQPAARSGEPSEARGGRGNGRRHLALGLKAKGKWRGK